MSAPLKLDMTLLSRGVCEKDMATYILGTIKEHGAEPTCRRLLAAVEQELIKPTVFCVFLSAAKSVDCTVACLRQRHSTFIRRQAIRQYGKLFSSGAWQKAWAEMGRTKGLLNFMSQVSVIEAKELLRFIGLSGRSAERSSQRQNAVEELLQAFYPALAISDHEPCPNPDKRPLQKYALQLVPACSEQFVQRMLRDENMKQLYTGVTNKKLIKSHPVTVRAFALERLKAAPKRLEPNVALYLHTFTGADTPVRSLEEGFTPAMSFSEELIHQRIVHKHVEWLYPLSDVHIYFSLLWRCRRKRVPQERLHDIFMLGIRLMQAYPASVNPFQQRGQLYHNLITRFWLKDQSTWEDVFVECIKLKGFHPARDNISAAFLRFVWPNEKVRHQRAYHLLKLYCLHAVDNGIDIDTATDFSPLAKQKWGTDVFAKISNDQSVRLLKNLLQANAKYDFLKLDGTNASILKRQALYDQRNFNALLLLTQQQAESDDATWREEAEHRSKDAVTELKGKATSAREQSDRAEYARAASHFAIASNSLDLYGEIVTWLQRFVRDPLTVKVIFATDTMATKEGSDLLSGIEKNLSPHTTLKSVAHSVEKANKILLEFQSHHQTAKREPSYQLSDWSGIANLMRAALSARIQRAASLQKLLNAADGELYGAIWSQTFALFTKIGHDSLYIISTDMKQLMSSLAPSTLANVTRSMLSIDNDYRTKRSKGGDEAEHETWVIESLTYSALLSLAGSDRPELAEDLIVQTIITRPDSSSWHRHMLSIGFLKRLPAKNAERLLLQFATAIGEKLEEQSYVRVGEATGAPSLIKVTTVKYLAQMLEGAEFLSAEASIDVLVELFKAATHPDVRNATLDSLLSTLDSLANAKLRQPVKRIEDVQDPFIRKIWDALVSVVPAIGSINERRPPRETDWAEAVEDLSKLPDPSSDISQRPLWSRFVSGSLNANLQHLFVQDILLPTIQESTRQHGRWLELFLKKHNAQHVRLQDLPAISAYPGMGDQLVASFPTLVPGSIFAEHDRYIRFVLAPSAAVVAFSNGLRRDETKNTKPDVRHWLATFAPPEPVAVLQNTVGTLIDRIHHSWVPSEIEDGITLKQHQIAILNHFKHLLEAYDANLKPWVSLTTRLRHPFNSEGGWEREIKAAEVDKWRSECRPVLKEIVKMVLRKRQDGWEHDPNRRPTILPSTFKLGLWLLDCPHPGISGDELERRCALLARGIFDAIKTELNERGEGYLRIDKLLNDVRTLTEVLSSKQRVLVALELAAIPSTDDDVASVLKADVASLFITLGKTAFKDDEDLKERVKQVFLEWQKNTLEEVRERVLELKTSRLWEEVMKKPAGVKKT